MRTTNYPSLTKKGMGKITQAKRKIISLTADALSYPTRSLYNAKRAASDRLADSLMARRKRRESYKSAWQKKHK